MKKRSSVVWQFFERIYDPHNNKRCIAVLCKLCDSEYKFFGNTTNLRTHLNIRHPIQWELLQNGTLDESTLRSMEEEDSLHSPSKRRKSMKNKNVDIVDDDPDWPEDTDAAVQIVNQIHKSELDEEWLEEDPTEIVQPKHKVVRYRRIKREIESPTPTRQVSNYVGYSPVKQNKSERIIIGENQRKDEYSVFGEYIANKLRKFTAPRTRGNIQQLITTILWQAEYGMYDNAETVKRVLMFSVQPEIEVEIPHVENEQVVEHNDEHNDEEHMMARTEILGDTNQD